MIRLSAAHSSSHSPDPAPTARHLVAQGATLLDVRTPAEFADAHVPGATNIPVQELAARLAELGERSRPVVVYCRSGARSSTAAGLLRQSGFSHVHDMGGMFNWGKDV
jgi:rhodanese-related sulfurtransferase